MIIVTHRPCDFFLLLFFFFCNLLFSLFSSMVYYVKGTSTKKKKKSLKIPFHCLTLARTIKILMSSYNIIPTGYNHFYHLHHHHHPPLYDIKLYYKIQHQFGLQHLLYKIYSLRYTLCTYTAHLYIRMLLKISIYNRSAKTTAVSILLLNNIFYDLRFFFFFFYSSHLCILFSILVILKMSQLELPQIEILSTDLNWLAFPVLETRGFLGLGCKESERISAQKQLDFFPCVVKLVVDFVLCAA